MNYQTIAAAIIAFSCLQASAADIAREVQQPAAGGSVFVELGLSLATGQLPLVGFNDQSLEESDDTIISLYVGLETRLEYKGFFAEIIENSFSDITFGYNALATDDTSVELILTSQFSDIERSEVVGFETIKNRDGDFGAGFRSSHYFGNSIIQFELVNDIVDSHNGVIASVQLGHHKQIRNWDVHGLVGVRYFSDDVVNHYFGVPADEATATLPAYSSGSGLMPSIQLGATKPLSEKLVFRATADYAKLPTEVVDSPLAQGDSIYSVTGGIYYVFQGV